MGSPAALGSCLPIHFLICVSPPFDTALSFLSFIHFESSSPSDLLSFSYLLLLDILDSHVFKPVSEHRSMMEFEPRFPPFSVCQPSPTLFFSSPSLPCVTSVRLRSHADASYRAAVCISSDVLLLTALTSSPSFLCPPRTHQRTLTRYTVYVLSCCCCCC